MSLILPQRGRLQQAAAGGGADRAAILDLDPILFMSVQEPGTDLWTDTGPATTHPSDGDFVAQMDNLGTSGGEATQTTENREVEFDDTGGINSLVYTGADDGDHLNYSSTDNSGVELSVFMAYQKDAADDRGMLIYDYTNNAALGIYRVSNGASSWSGSYTTSPSGKIYIDNSVIGNTRGNLHDALDDGAWHIIEWRGIEWSGTAFNDIRPAYGAAGFGFGPHGLMSDIIFVATANFDDTDRTTTILPYLEGNVGL